MGRKVKDSNRCLRQNGSGKTGIPKGIEKEKGESAGRRVNGKQQVVPEIRRRRDGRKQIAE